MRVSARQRPAKSDGATDRNPKTYILFYFFAISLLLLSLYSIPHLKIQKPQRLRLDLQKQRKEKKLYLSCCRVVRVFVTSGACVVRLCVCCSVVCVCCFGFGCYWKEFEFVRLGCVAAFGCAYGCVFGMWGRLLNQSGFVDGGLRLLMVCGRFGFVSVLCNTPISRHKNFIK